MRNEGEGIPIKGDVMSGCPLGIFSPLFSAALLGMKLRPKLSSQEGKAAVKCLPSSPLCVHRPRILFLPSAKLSLPFPSGNEYYVDRVNETDGQ